MLELKHISKRFGDKQIFSDYSLEIPAGETLANCRAVWWWENNLTSNASWLRID